MNVIAIFGSLRGNVWDRNGIRFDIMRKVYKLYVYEILTVYKRHAKRLNHLHTKCLRKLLTIRWQCKVQETEFLFEKDRDAKHTAVYLLLKRAILRRACVTR